MPQKQSIHIFLDILCRESLEYQYLSGEMIEWRLLEVKQHKYKLGLGWVTIWWVVILIRRRKECYDHNINQEPNARGDS